MVLVRMICWLLFLSSRPVCSPTEASSVLSFDLIRSVSGVSILSMTWWNQKPDGDDGSSPLGAALWIYAVDLCCITCWIWLSCLYQVLTILFQDFRWIPVCSFHIQISDFEVDNYFIRFDFEFQRLMTHFFRSHGWRVSCCSGLICSAEFGWCRAVGAASRLGFGQLLDRNHISICFY